MTFPNYGFIDQFNRADEDPLSGGGKWFRGYGSFADFRVSGNAALKHGTTPDWGNYYNALTVASNWEVRVKIFTPWMTALQALSGVVVVNDTPGGAWHGYLAWISTTTSATLVDVQIQKVDRITNPFILTVSSVPWNSGDELGFDLVGDLLTVYRNGTALGNVHDSTYTGPNKYLGIYTNDPQATMDDFGGGPLVMEVSVNDSRVPIGDFAAVGSQGNLLVYDVPTPPSDVVNMALSTPIPNIIVDTDFGTDIDDDADVWLALLLERMGLCNILGFISTWNHDSGAPCLKACIDYMGRSSIPIGAWQGFLAINPPDLYGATVRDAFRPGDVRSNYTSAASAYRSMLANATGRVKIIIVGTLTSVQALMNSGADQWSSLTGQQLVAATVSELIVCAGLWPDSVTAGGPEYNMYADPSPAADVIANWPTPIMFAGIELAGFVQDINHASQSPNSIADGFGLKPHGDASTNPFHKAWDQADSVDFSLNPGSILDSNGLRTAWGNTAVMYGVFGLGTYYNVAGANGSASVNGSTGHNLWTSTPGTRSYLGLAMSRSAIQADLMRYFTADFPVVADPITVTDQPQITLSVSGALQVGVSDPVSPSDVPTVSSQQPTYLAIAVNDTKPPDDLVFVLQELIVEPPDSQDQLWRPTWLIDLSQIDPALLATAGYTASYLYFSTVDIDTLPSVYSGRLVTAPTINRKLVDVFWGTLDVAELTLTLANVDGFLTNLLSLVDIREQPIILQRYDLTTNTMVEQYNARISSVSLEPGKFSISANSPATTLFEQLIPSTMITPANYPKAVDVNIPVSVVFGDVAKVPCPYVNDDTVQDFYDYIVGHGVLSVVAVYRNGPNQTMVLAHTSEYAVYTNLYPGITSIRFFNRQVDFSNAFYKIYADVVAPIRNFADAIKAVMTDATWGLGQTVDTASFTAASTLLSGIGLYCDGVINTQIQAQDVLRQLSMVRGLRLGFDDAGNWNLAVDQIPSSIAMRVQDGIGDSLKNIVLAGPRTLDNTSNSISQFVLNYRLDFTGTIVVPSGSKYVFSQQRPVNLFGKQKVINHDFIRDHVTADKICDYLAKRQKYGQDVGQFELDQSARGLREGDLLELTHLPNGYDTALVEVISVNLKLESTSVVVAAWAPSIFQYEPASVLPTAADSAALGPVTTLVAPSVPTGLVAYSSTFIDLDGHTKVFLDVMFDASPESDVVGYEVQFRRVIDNIWTTRQLDQPRQVV